MSYYGELPFSHKKELNRQIEEFNPDVIKLGAPPERTQVLRAGIDEFGEDNGVVYVDRPEDVVAKALELVQNGSVEELGSKARSFVERNSWDNITEEFEKNLRGRYKGETEIATLNGAM